MILLILCPFYFLHDNIILRSLSLSVEEIKLNMRHIRPDLKRGLIFVLLAKFLKKGPEIRLETSRYDNLHCFR